MFLENVTTVYRHLHDSDVTHTRIRVDSVTVHKVNEHNIIDQTTTRPAPLSFREKGFGGAVSLVQKLCLPFSSLSPACIFVQKLYLFFCPSGTFFGRSEERKSARPTDRVCMKTSLICPQILILSKRQGRGTSSSLRHSRPVLSCEKWKSQNVTLSDRV
jgi:hypothetical protein